MNSRNILHIIAAMDPKKGGVCKAVRMIISGLEKHDIQNEVVSLDSPYAPYLKDDSFPIHALGPGISPWYYSNKLIPWLTYNFSRFDVVILHGLWLYTGYALVKSLRLFEKMHSMQDEGKNAVPKVFIMPHGMLDPYFQQAENRKFKAVRNWAYWKFIECSVINQSDGLLFTSVEEKRLASKSFRPYTPIREMVVSLGVEEPPNYTTSMQKAFLEKCPEVQSTSYFLFLGRVHEKKGVDILIKAYDKWCNSTASITSSHTANDFLLTEREIPNLVIAGPDFESNYARNLQKLVFHNAALKHRIHFTGMLTGDAKWGAFYGCEAFILPSHQENFGIAVVEALACNKPVLISNQVNIWREIVEAGGGLVADDTQEGIQEMFQTWENLLCEEKVIMNKNARHSYEKCFSIYSTASRILNAINLSC